jgi:type VI secretion system secreted protein Hcp
MKPDPSPRGAGAADMYLSVVLKRAGKGKGEGAAAGHEEDIIVRSWSWGAAGHFAHTSVQATGRRTYKHLSIVKGLDTASTALLTALAVNDEVREAKLTMRKAGADEEDFFHILLKNARVTSVDYETDAHGDTVEVVNLSFVKVEVEYRVQQSSGQHGAAFVFEDELEGAS